MKKDQSLRVSGMLFLLLLIFNVNHVQAQAEDGVQVAKMAPAPVSRGYLQYLPPNYSSTTQNYPCIIFLHGSGQKGNGSPADLMKICGINGDSVNLGQGTPRFIRTGSTMCFTLNGVTECFIVLSPQQIPSRWGWLGYEVMPFVNYALATYRIDPNRVYLTGLSMGGDGTWDNSYASENNPNYFAAMAPVSCKGDYNLAKITASRKIPVWAFHGDADTSVPLSDGKRPINGMNAAIPSPNPAPIWTVIPGGKHDRQTWDKVYNPALNNFNSTNIYKWFLTKTRPSTGNQIPTVNAGIDKIITLPTNSVIINGTATDSDGTISTYAWSQTSGSPATLTNIATANLTASGLVAGTYVFRLTVTDNGGATNSDEVTVVVNPISNVAPTANAGADKTITLPTNTITLSGSGTDSDGTIASYLWTKVSGPTDTQSGETTANLTLSGLVLGVYVFQLTVTDNQGGLGADNVSVTVLADPLPIAPSNPSATAVSATQINLSWTDGSTNETGFEIERSLNSIDFLLVQAPVANAISSTNNNLSPATLYYYRIRAINTAGSSSYSPVVSATTFKQTPTWINKQYVTEDAAGTLTKPTSQIPAGASSQEVLQASTDGWVETEVDQLAKSRTIGLSDVDVDKTKSTIDYGIELGANNNVYTWESGVRSNNTVGGTTLNYSIGEVYRIERQTNAILFKRNGVTFRTASASSTSSLIVDVNLETINGRLYNTKISFGFSGSAPGGRVASSHAIIESNKNSTTENGNSLTVYPNPVRSVLFISLSEKTKEPLKIRILDNTGKIEWEGVAKSYSDIISIDLASTKVSSGIKIISIVKSNGEVVHKRLQKID